MKLQYQGKDIICGFGVVVFDYENEDLDKTVKSIMNIDYHKSAYKIIISSSHNERAGELFHYINQFKSNEILSELIISLDLNLDIEKDAYSKCDGATHFVKVEAGQTIDSNLFKTINDLALEDNKKYISFEKNNIKIINFETINGMYLDFGSFDLLFNSLKETAEHKNLDER